MPPLAQAAIPLGPRFLTEPSALHPKHYGHRSGRSEEHGEGRRAAGGGRRRAAGALRSGPHKAHLDAVDQCVVRVAAVGFEDGVVGLALNGCSPTQTHLPLCHAHS